MINVKKIGAWSQVGRLLASAPQRVNAAFDKALLQEAQFLRTKIVEGIREQAPGGQAFTPLAPTTLAIRRFRGFSGTKALVVQGDLRNSISVIPRGRRCVRRCAADREEPQRPVPGRHRGAAGARLSADRHDPHPEGARLSPRRVPAGWPRPAARPHARDRHRDRSGSSATLHGPGLRAVCAASSGLQAVPGARRREFGPRLRHTVTSEAT